MNGYDDCSGRVFLFLTIEFVDRTMTALFADDFHHFHLIELPSKLLLGAGDLAAKATRELEPLCVRISNSDNAYTYRPGPKTVSIIAGTEAALEIELELDSWSLWRDGSVARAEIHRCVGVDHDKSDQAAVSQWRIALEIIYRK